MSRLYADEVGFIVSAELVLVSTIVVLGMLVGLSEAANGINEELEDIGFAFGSINQSCCYSGAEGHRGHIYGSSFKDRVDFCDSESDISSDFGSTPEGRRW